MKVALNMAVAVAALTAAAPAAHASYSVTALAETRNGIYGEYGRGYNVQSYDAMAIPGGPGFTTFGGGCNSNFSVCNVGGYGTTDKSPNLKSAIESTSVDVTTTPSFFYPQGLTASGSAYARANLAKGSVGITSQGTYLTAGAAGSGQAGGVGVSAAGAFDTLHFSVAGASADTVTTIGVTFRTHGVVNPFTPAGDSFASLESVLQLGGGFFEGNVFSGGATGYVPVFSAGPPPSGWLTESISPAGPGDYTFHGTLALTGPTQDLGVAEYISGNCGLGTACDYAHTASLSFSMPGAVSYTSDSGVFLTQPAGGVPEPAAWMLLLTGAAATGATLRRRRRIEATAATEA